MPKQDRARTTIDAILEATAQIIETHGEAQFNTNRIAERAGVSIGTLYQYFPDKQSILREMARRETQALHDDTAKLGPHDKERLAIQRLIGAFAGRGRLRHVLVKTLAADVGHLEPAAVNAELDRTSKLLSPQMRLGRLDAYVLTRAVLGVVRAAVLEDTPFLHKPEFLEALLRLTRSYRAALKSEKASR
ncbi:MAG TPA: helix-turn-helix domain-containing protein [Rhizomicrobium sp.]|jgi:AcrR family transcriptional regulator|nr:helix-turn-helix domain-containing protein [Rhizomicrobium sp.]